MLLQLLMLLVLRRKAQPLELLLLMQKLLVVRYELQRMRHSEWRLQRLEQRLSPLQAVRWEKPVSAQDQVAVPLLPDSASTSPPPTWRCAAATRGNLA